MNFVVFSDIHSNYVALNALYDIINERYRGFEIICLGDLVGYFPLTTELEHSLGKFVGPLSCQFLTGNHDSQYLEEQNENWFSQLIESSSEVVSKEKMVFSHGAHYDPLNIYCYPDLHFYTSNKSKYENGYAYITGHTHRPFIEEQNSLLVNVGSLGMPRNWVPHGTFLTIIDGVYEINELHYNLDLWYEVNKDVNNRVKNRIYFGGRSDYLDNELLEFTESEKTLLCSILDYPCCYSRIVYTDNISVCKILLDKDVVYLLRFRTENEMVFNNLEEVIQWIK